MASPSTSLRFHEVHGEWWLPDDAAVRCSGVLSVDERGVRVRVHGHLSEAGLPGMGDLLTHPVVYGRLESGQDVTLARAFTVTSNQTLFGNRERGHSELAAVELFVGAHLPDPVDQRYAAFALTVPGLLRWASITGIRAEPLEGAERLAMRFAYERPVDRLAELHDGGGYIRLRTAAKQELGRGETRFAVSEWGLLVVEPVEPLDLGRFRSQYAIPLERLLTFSHDETVAASQVSARLVNKEDQWVDVVTGRERELTVEWRAPHRYVLAASTEEIFAALVPKWLDLHGRFRIPLDVHFAHAYAEGVPVERRLSEATQALEGFDRIALPVSESMRTTHSDHIARLRELVSGEPAWARRLVGRLEYAYEPSLANRFSRQLKLEHDTIPLGGRGREALARKMATHRNFLAHLDSGRDQPPVDELYETGAHTTTLVKLMILRELGLSGESRRRICENRQWPRPGRPTIYLT